MRYLPFIAVLAFFSCGPSASSDGNEAGSKLSAFEAEAKTALDKLMQSDNPFGYVIFEEVKSKKFVQFAGSKNQALVFDLPTAQMSKEELAKAKEVLAQYGIDHHSGGGAQAQGSPVIASFSKTIDLDTQLGAALATEVMDKVYGFDHKAEIAILAE